MSFPRLGLAGTYGETGGGPKLPLPNIFSHASHRGSISARSPTLPRNSLLLPTWTRAGASLGLLSTLSLASVAASSQTETSQDPVQLHFVWHTPSPRSVSLGDLVPYHLPRTPSPFFLFRSSAASACAPHERGWGRLLRERTPFPQTRLVRGPGRPPPPPPVSGAAPPGRAGGAHGRGTNPTILPARLPHRGARLQLVGGSRSVPASVGFPGSLLRAVGEPRAGRQRWGWRRAETAATRLRNPSGWEPGAQLPPGLKGRCARRAVGGGPGSPLGPRPCWADRGMRAPGCGRDSRLGPPGSHVPFARQALRGKTKRSPSSPPTQFRDAQKPPAQSFVFHPKWNRAPFICPLGGRVGRSRDWKEGGSMFLILKNTS